MADVIATNKPRLTRKTMPAAVETPQFVEARVTKKGDGRISTGDHVAGEGDIYYDRDDIIQVPAEAVEELEERGWIEAK